MPERALASTWNHCNQPMIHHNARAGDWIDRCESSRHSPSSVRIPPPRAASLRWRSFPLPRNLRHMDPHAPRHCRPTRPARAGLLPPARASHYENFTVASWLLPRRLLPHFYAIYAYCRWADDLADETAIAAHSPAAARLVAGRAGPLLRGHGRAHPVFVALRPTIEEFSIPAEPFERLLTAFRQDQRQSRYATHDDVLAYCRNSANPVGRLILYLGRCHDEARGRLVRFDLHGTAIGQFLPGRGPRLGEGPRLSAAGDAGRGRLRRGHVRPAASATRPCAGPCGSKWTGPRRICSEVGRWSSCVPRELRLEVALFVGGRIEHSAGDSRARLRRVASPADGRPAAQTWLVMALLAEHASARAQGGATMNDELAASYAHCQRIARRSASSFYYSFLLLPKPKRLAMCALVRVLAPHRRLGRQPGLGRPTGGGPCTPGGDRSSAPPRGATTIRCCRPWPIRSTPFRFRCEYLRGRHRRRGDGSGARRLSRRSTELEQYCHRVASAVGLACLRIWGCRAAAPSSRRGSAAWHFR